MRIKSVSWDKNIHKKKKRKKKKRVRKCESKDENTNWNSCKGSVKKNDKLLQKRPKKKEKILDLYLNQKGYMT
jgi:hypothetical protein